VKPFLVMAGAVLAAVLAAVVIHALAVHNVHTQTAQQPALPASITIAGRTYPCGPVRQAWDSGNMDQWDSYPSDVGFRCITG
jgi:hypothetical protein